MSDDVITLLPPASTTTERELDRTFTRSTDLPVGIRDARYPDTCPPHLLPWLAWEMSVDNWRTEWSNEQRAQVVSNSPAMHRRKGSASAVQLALLALGYEVRVHEWFQQIPIGLPFTFQLLLDVDQVGIDQDGMTRILEVVETHKNLRSHLTQIKLNIRSHVDLFCAAATSLGHLITLPVSNNGIILNEHVLVTA